MLRSDSLSALKTWSRTVAQAMEQNPLLVDVDSVDDDEARQVVLDIDREAARRLGVPQDFTLVLVASLLICLGLGEYIDHRIRRKEQ